jgi:hypothetical protein
LLGSLFVQLLFERRSEVYSSHQLSLFCWKMGSEL